MLTFSLSSSRMSTWGGLGSVSIASSVEAFANRRLLIYSFGPIVTVWFKFLQKNVNFGSKAATTVARVSSRYVESSYSGHLERLTYLATFLGWSGSTRCCSGHHQHLLHRHELYGGQVDGGRQEEDRYQYVMRVIEFQLDLLTIPCAHSAS